MEGKGDWDPIKYEKNKTVMINLWQQIAQIADFDKNGEVDTEEFMGGVETACKGKNYDDLPEAFKFFIEAQFRTIDGWRRLHRLRRVPLRLCQPYGLFQCRSS